MNPGSTLPLVLGSLASPASFRPDRLLGSGSGLWAAGAGTRPGHGRALSRAAKPSSLFGLKWLTGPKRIDRI